jgi:hypothetical protein
MTEKEKTYKSKLDARRLYHIVAALFYLRDYAPALAADLSREVKALTIRLAEQQQ